MAVVAILAVVTGVTLGFAAPRPFFIAPFRESQTAISALAIARGESGLLDYITPVLGVPWQMPFEFGLFQWLVGNLAPPSPHGVAATGRLLNLASVLACGGTVFWLLSRWSGAARQVAVVTTALFFVTPVYLATATGHLIEGWALFGGLACLALVGPSLSAPSGTRLMVASVAGVFCALLKLTTWIPVAAWLGVMGVMEAWQRRAAPTGRTKWRLVGAGVALLVIPLAVGGWWTVHAESVRAQNPLGAELNKTVGAWMLGTPTARLSPTAWLQLAGKHALLLFGPLFVLVPPLARRWWREGPDTRVRQLLVCCLAAYAVHILLFFTLHLRHDYYLIGSGVFLVIAAGLILGSSARAHVRLLPATAVVLAASGLGYQLLRQSYLDYESAAAVEALHTVEPDRPVVLLGFDWSPFIPFWSDRRALMFEHVDLPPEALRRVALLNQEAGYGAVLFLGERYRAFAEASATAFGVDTARSTSFGLNGVAFGVDGRATLAAGSTPARRTLAFLEERIPRSSDRPDGLVYRRVSLPFTASGWGAEFAVRRRSDLFFFQAQTWSLGRMRGYFVGP